MTPAIAFRVWGVEEMLSGPRLVSPFRYTVWHPGGPLEAACRDESNDREHGRMPKAPRGQPDLAPPIADCGCGIYGYHDVERMKCALAAGLVGGAALCWGRIAIHQEGVRAQFARPLALCLPDGILSSRWNSAPLMRIAACYGVPLLEASNISLYAREFGENYQPGLELSESWGSRAAKSFRDLCGRWFGG